ncbi:MAG: histidinol-phosphatase HisJ family protein [candidate division Zixibacteria bacterium]|nr:histidinol-phosphatase HisJ family protein [candidate division Zixibacteria bacterium]
MLRFPVGDSHVHPDCSIDAEGSLRQFCEQALTVSLQQITFTTHYEITPAGRDKYGYFVLDGQRHEANPDSVKRYVDQVRAVGREFFPLGLKVLCGLEIGWHESIHDRLVRELPGFDLDLVIGSVHELGGVHFSAGAEGPDFFKTHSLDEWISEYFAAAEQIARSGLFNLLGHLDVYKRNALPVYGEKVKEAYRPYLPPLFRAMIEHDLALEVNTSGIRHGVGEYYPSMAIINEARRTGVTIAALGSDAHRPDQLALDFETALQLVYELLPRPLEDGREY